MPDRSRPLKNILLTLLAAGVCLSATAAPLFRNPLPVNAGTDYFELMEKGDFNGDGHKDVLLIHSHESARVISVLLANGIGPFAAPVLTTIDTDYGPYAAGIGDVNEDGTLDLVLTKGESFGVLFGNGDGTFTQGPAFPGSTFLTGPVTLGDFNGDQHLDVAAGNIGDPTMNSHAVEVHFGNGTGSFSGLVELPGGGVGVLETLDINADGNTDLLVSRNFGNQIYLGSAAGTFTPGPGTSEGRVAPGDFNHDGKLDLALAAGQTHSWYVQVWFANGDGTLTGGAKYSCGYAASDISAADVDGDGNPDLLTPSYNSSVTVMRGKADGTFHAPETWVGGPASYNIVTDDFDRDGKVDFVTPAHDQGGINRLAFVRGKGDGTFHTSHIRHTGSVVPVHYPGLEITGTAIADMNGDDHPDVVISQDKPSPGFGNGDIGVLLNDGTGRLAAPLLTDATVPAGPFAARDVNNDGKIDVVTISSPYDTPRPRTLLGNGDGTFGTPIPFSVNGAGFMFLDDFAGDANLDLFVDSSDFVTVYPGNGSGTFGTGIRTNLSDSQDAVTGDLNGDGKMDWVGWNVFSATAFVNDGTGHFAALASMEIDGEVSALADFTGDGKADLLLTNYWGLTETLPGNGDGTFGPPIPFWIEPVSSGPVTAPLVATADFDGDGKLDVALDTSVFLGNGDGRFRARARAQIRNITGTAAGDMDGNGSPDLVTVNRYADDVAVFLTRTTSDPTALSSVALSSDQPTGQYGKGITFTAAVTGGLVPLTGAVTFFVNGTPQAIIAVDAEGTATFTTGFVIGSHNVTATYAGDENYVSSSDSMTQAVGKGQPAATINGFPNPRPAHQLVTIVVSLSAQRYSQFAAPTGAMTLRDGNTPLNLTIINGQASTRDLTIGSHEISVDYPGDENYEPATASYTQVITKGVPGVFVTATPSGPVHEGTPVTYRAQVGASNATGTITFSVNSVDQATVSLKNAAAELQLTLPWGYHNVRARYSGDANWAESQGSTNADVLIGPWGTPLRVDATHLGGGSLGLRWARVTDGMTYTIWRKKTLLDAWELAGLYDSNVYGASTHMDQNKTWMYAATVTDGEGNVSPMGPPDIATAVTFTDPTIVGGSTKIKASHLTELRTAVDSVRTFAGLAPYSYTNAIAPGAPIRASDVQQLRTALAQARSTIGLPALAFGDPTLTPSASLVRAMHIEQLRAGTN